MTLSIRASIELALTLLQWKELSFVLVIYV